MKPVGSGNSGISVVPPVCSLSPPSSGPPELSPEPESVVPPVVLSP